MAIYRVNTRTDQFKTVDNAAAQDPRLSWKAKGLHWYCLTLPDDWTFYQSELTAHAKDGKAALASAIRELVKYGYWNMNTVRNQGKFETHYDIWEDPLYNAEFQREIDGTPNNYRVLPPPKRRKTLRTVTENQQRRKNRYRKSVTATVAENQQRLKSPETEESHRYRKSVTEKQPHSPLPIFGNGKSGSTKEEKTKEEDQIRSDRQSQFSSQNLQATTPGDAAIFQYLFEQYPDAQPPLTKSRLREYCTQHHLTLEQLKTCFIQYAPYVRKGGRYLGYIHTVLENQGPPETSSFYGDPVPAPCPVESSETESARTPWERVLHQVHHRMNGNPAYQMWISPLHPQVTTADVWRFEVPDPVFVGWITDHYLTLLQEEIHHATGTTPAIEFVVKPAQEAA